jgi:hypothetical protein
LKKIIVLFLLSLPIATYSQTVLDLVKLLNKSFTQVNTVLESKKWLYNGDNGTDSTISYKWNKDSLQITCDFDTEDHATQLGFLFEKVHYLAAKKLLTENGYKLFKSVGDGNLLSKYYLKAHICILFREYIIKNTLDKVIDTFYWADIYETE